MIKRMMRLIRIVMIFLISEANNNDGYKTKSNTIRINIKNLFKRENTFPSR